MKHTHCPSCTSQDLEVFYEIRNAPVFSLVTVKSQEEALEIPRKDISLALCHQCGFIFNSSFDTSIDFFTQGYEDQQGFSPTFVSFITGVTQRFIDKHKIQNKTVVEIGSGKGDFLSLISQLGNNKGIGIDPAWVPGRQEGNDNLTFIKEFYDENHGKLNPDCICCRHTFEHIHETREFLKRIRVSIVEDSNPVLFFEIPSIIRILKINAFWDIFYEHCSYFGPGSLARLFRATGFNVLDLYLENNDQYLFIEAEPANEIPTGVHRLEEPIETLKELVDHFSRHTQLQLNTWKNKLLDYKHSRQKVVVWGGGSKAVGFLTHFHDLDVIEHVIDINPHMTGNFIPGIGIQYKSPEFLKEYKPDKVIIMNGVYQNEIGKMLNEMGLYPDLESLDSER